jgi:ribosomal protein L40E
MSKYGEMDKNLRNRYRGHWLVCPKGHLNSPNAKMCDKCGSTNLVKEDRRNTNDLLKRGSGAE